MADKLSERLEREAARTVQWQTLHGGGPITKQANPTHVVNLLREAAELARRVEGAQVGRVDMVCASDAVVVDELDRPVSINKKRVRLVPEQPEAE